MTLKTKYDTVTETKCETQYETVYDEQCAPVVETVYDNKCETVYDTVYEVYSWGLSKVFTKDHNFRKSVTQCMKLFMKNNVKLFMTP